MKILATILLCVLTAGSSSASSPSEILTWIHDKTHTIEQTEYAVGEQICSATAIGPYALLTATHCELPSDTITVDEIEATIVRRERDGKDHTIYFLKGVKFEKYAEIRTKPLLVGDDIYFWGNPGEYSDIARRGYLAEVSPKSLLFDIQAFPGDSGAGIFDSEGNIVSVVSLVSVQHSEASWDAIRISLTVVFPLAFDSAIIDSARKYVERK